LYHIRATFCDKLTVLILLWLAAEDDCVGVEVSNVVRFTDTS